MNNTVIMVFTKSLQAGKVKTRFIPYLGSLGALALYRRLLQIMLHKLLAIDSHRSLWIKGERDVNNELHDLATEHGMLCFEQRGRNLGESLAKAFARSLEEYNKVLVTGGDCIAVPEAVFRQAIVALDEHDCVLVPAIDGGFVVFGLRNSGQEELTESRIQALFDGVEWGGNKVCRQVLDRLECRGLSVWLTQAFVDIDEPEDLKAVLADYPELGEIYRQCD